ncbi:hypothetical protein [Mucilaginibacter sp. UR6-11]|uniref:hypothetical protein n=1 Tax=Mucilaginibacter sp. UR6-11 TaxID=1435644 RepID=UPI001E5295B9|nr:hypothetical protein [Mucilaginibacter sp. UR6-11]MCC8425245.1 hypothetical protein [Mucilaginibacter sp. UR6-11]
MIKYTTLFITFLLAVLAFQAKSQTTATTSSPYTQYGLGDLTPMILPQNQAMGGISTGTNTINRYMSINPQNPASYATIAFTTIDAGVLVSSLSLSQTGQSTQKNSNFRLSHLAFAIPVTSRSALSFGLMPYSQVGYNYTKSVKGFGTGSPVDTNAINYIYSGEGGLTKAYAGYGFSIGRNLLLGANVSYIFGNLKHNQQVEMPQLPGTLNTNVERNNAVGGVSYDFGAQYIVDLSLTRHIVFGYSGSAGSQLNSKSSYIVSHYTFDTDGNKNVDVDSVINQQNNSSKIKLPQIHHFGFSYQQDLKFLIGADYSIGKWADLRVDGVNPGTVNSHTLNVGGQYTPNINALHNSLATLDYRLGFIVDKSYYNVPNATGDGFTNITSKAVTLGLGVPLRGANTSFYKLNFSAELGQRGTLNNGLVKENYVNFRLGFTLNDKWFQRYKFD